MSDRETIVKANSMGIATTNRLFVKVAQIGQCDAKGRAMFAQGYKGKFIAEPDQPIRTLILPLMIRLIEFCKWENPDQAKAELELLQRYVGKLTLNTPAPKAEGQP